jgi:phosphohistidine phosphatase
MKKKELYIIRHAKSDWNFDVSDFDRPLNPRGIADAPNMGKHLKSNFSKPDYIISSPANRAISTARLIAKEVEYELTSIQQAESAYNAPYTELLKLINNTPEEFNTLFLFAHNPGVSDLVHYLSDTPTELKTCCVVQLIPLVNNWTEVFQSNCELVKYISPKSI